VSRFCFNGATYAEPGPYRGLGRRRPKGLETLRNWSEKAVKRSVPFLLGLYSLIAIRFALHVEEPERACIRWPWYKKPHVAFSDMLAAARADIMGGMLFERSRTAPCEHKLWRLKAFPAMMHCFTRTRAA